MLVVTGEENWNCPGAMFVAMPTIVQVLNDNAGFVVESTSNGPLEVLAKLNPNSRLSSN